MPGAFQLAAAAIRTPAVAAAFRSGAGFPWHEHDPELFEGTERFFRPGTPRTWWTAGSRRSTGCPLTTGARVADVGCGHGATTIMMARAFPRSTFVGFDYHEASIAWAAAGRGRGRRRPLRVRGGLGAGLPRRGYDLVAFFDPCTTWVTRGAARHVRRAGPRRHLAGGRAERRRPVADNLNPVGRIYYNASTLICVPNALARTWRGARRPGRRGGDPGSRRRRGSAGSGGPQTPFNLVLEARP